jgi:hypothetical protein
MLTEDKGGPEVHVADGARGAVVQWGRANGATWSLSAADAVRWSQVPVGSWPGGPWASSRQAALFLWGGLWRWVGIDKTGSF